MSTISGQLKQSGDLLQALDAVRNVKALIVSLAMLVAAAAIGGLFAQTVARTGSVAIGGLGALVVFFTVFVGINAAGVLLMDEAQGYEPRSLVNALLAGVFATLKGIVLFLLLLIVALLILAATAIVFWICKVPGLGPVLFAAALPLGVIVTGLLGYAFFLVLFGVAAPALWRGETIIQALAQALLVAQRKVLQLVVLHLLVSLLTALAAIVIWTVLLIGTFVAGPMSFGIIGVEGDLSTLFGGGLGEFSGRRGGESLAGYLVAGGIGGAVLVAAAWLVPWLILMKGACLIYVRLIEGLDFSKAEAHIKERVEQLKQRAEAAAERSRQASQRPAVAAPAPAPPAPASEVREAAPPQTGPTCPSCGGRIQVADLFCESCGAPIRS